MEKVKPLEFAVGTTLADMEKQLLEATLRHHGDDKIASAKSLGISSRHVYNLIRKYGIKVKRTHISRLEPV